MNELIKDLLCEAGGTVMIDNHGVDFETINTSNLDAELFADLIVRECAQVCLSQRDPANLNYKPSEKFATAVKEHFGVD